MPDVILAGDLGGTNVRLGLFTVDARRPPAAIAIQRYQTRNHSGLSEVVSAFQEDHRRRISRATFGVAGPVSGRRATISNLPWTIDADELERELDIGLVTLCNDLEANAHGIAALSAEDFVTLHPGRDDPSGNQALIAAGTGLGQAGLHWEGDCYRPFPSEGGHVDFAPRDELQIDLLRHLRGRWAHVSYERVLSGPAIDTLYRFLRDTRRGDEPEWLAESLARGDRPRTISQLALEGRSDLCARTLDLFVALYGAQAGNLALEMLATGGVFLGGGIAPRILPFLRKSIFTDAFVDKGRMMPLLQRIQVRVISNDMTALLGAARICAGQDCR